MNINSPTIETSDRAGIGYMLGGMFLFTVNDAIGKWLVTDYSVGQILAIRSMASLLILFPLLFHKREISTLFSFENPWLHGVRLILIVGEVSCFYWSVRYLPLADVFMFYLTVPIFMTVFSAVILKEKVGFMRWSAVLIGFSGVILIFPPSDAALSLPALIALTGSITMAFIMILTRKLRNAGSLQLVTLQALAVGAAGSVTLPFAWVTPNGVDFSLLCLLGVVATAGHFMINHSVKVSPASVVAPFNYSSIVWATILGYIFWGDIPTARSMVGVSIIIGCGLFIFYREGRLAKR